MTKNAYYNDYNRSSFYVDKTSFPHRYYIKVDSRYIEVSESVYKTCRNSYAKMKYAHFQEAEWLNSQNKEFNQSAFLVSSDDKTMIKTIVSKDLAKLSQLAIDN